MLPLTRSDPGDRRRLYGPAVMGSAEFSAFAPNRGDPPDSSRMASRRMFLIKGLAQCGKPLEDEFVGVER